MPDIDIELFKKVLIALASEIILPDEFSDDQDFYNEGRLDGLEEAHILLIDPNLLRIEARRFGIKEKPCDKTS